MIVKNKSIYTYLIVFGFLASFLLSIASTVEVYAVYGRSDGKGYFDNHSEGGDYDSSSDVISGGIPDSKDTASELISFLKGLSGSRNKTAAAFVVNTMLGRNGPGKGRSVSSTDWNELEKRLKAMDGAGRINWDKDKSPCDETNAYYQTDHNDDAFFDMPSKSKFKELGKSSSWISSHCKNHSIIEFKNESGHVVYRLDRKCGNPMGDGLDEIPEAKEWYISATGSSNMATAAPGQTITWTNRVRNDGPDETTKSIHSNVVLSGFSNGWNGTRADGDTGSGKSTGTIRTISDYSVYTVTQNDVGNTLCERVQYQPKSWEDGGSGAGNNSCVFVPYNYALQPFANAGTNYIESNIQFTFTPYVINSPLNNVKTKSEIITWQVSMVVYNPGAPVLNPNTGGYSNSGADPCQYFLPNNGCSAVNNGNDTVFNSDGAYLSGKSLATNAAIGNYDAGTRVCFALSLKPNRNTIAEGKDDRWRHSVLDCQIISKKPKIQIWGGDLWSGGIAKTSTSAKIISGANRTFGSWVEYGVFATGSISGVGSGSAYAGPGLADADAKLCSLNFTNTNSQLCAVGAGSTVMGNYKTSRSISDVAGSFPDLGNNISGAITASDLDSGTYNVAGDLTLNTSTLLANKSIIIKATGTVTIVGNQQYSDGPYTNISQLPQLVIIANRIIINNSATQVDAWLVANNATMTGRIDTCEKEGTTTGDCNNMLTVNGPVMTDHLYLYRTAGSGNGVNSGDPAEVFNLRPDAYLWASARAINGSHIHTVYTADVPPRF